eukprot:5839853-Amphidinium_carterae.1
MGSVCVLTAPIEGAIHQFLFHDEIQMRFVLKSKGSGKPLLGLRCQSRLKVVCATWLMALRFASHSMLAHALSSLLVIFLADVMEQRNALGRVISVALTPPLATC